MAQIKDRVFIRSFVIRAVRDERALQFHMNNDHSFIAFPAMLNDHWCVVWTNKGRSIVDLDRVGMCEPLSNGELREFLVGFPQEFLDGLAEDRESEKRRAAQTHEQVNEDVIREEDQRAIRLEEREAEAKAKAKAKA